MSFKNLKVKFFLARQQRQQAKKAFRIFDQDDSGQISIRQFDQILKSLGQNLSQQQLQQIMNQIDKDGNGFIDFQQFLQLVAPSQKSFVEAFKILDQNDDGILDREQLKRANLISGANLSEDDIDAIMKYVEDKYNGKFTLNHILKMLFRKPFNHHQSTNQY